jgi:ABC-type Fe3+/spermidine/putrescine transport system ATPase subunit
MTVLAETADRRAGLPRPPALELRGVVVAFDRGPVLGPIDLRVGAGETLALLGPSGAGKSTLLAAAAGFVPILDGEIRVADRLVATPTRALPPEERSVGVVFQNAALWPHLDARSTVAFPLRRRGYPALAARESADRLLERLGVAELADRRPAQLSGGEQQRVGLARALARDAGLYLFDEPTAHLDTPLRAALQRELVDQRRATGAAAVHATHDVAEAFAVADRVALLRAGGLVQEGSPAEIYERPVNLWAAHLTGPASVVDRAIVRPEWCALGGPGAGRVTAVLYRGPFTDYEIAWRDGTLTVRDPGPPRLAVGDTATFRINRTWPIPAAGG